MAYKINDALGDVPELPEEDAEQGGEEMTTKREKGLLHKLVMMKIDLDHQTWLAKFERRWQRWFSLMALAMGLIIGGAIGGVLTQEHYAPTIEDYQQAVCDLKFGEGYTPEVVDDDPRNIRCVWKQNEVDDTGIYVGLG